MICVVSYLNIDILMAESVDFMELKPGQEIQARIQKPGRD